MHTAYEDLLAYQGLDEAVDRLYQAYLDTTLMEFEDRTKVAASTESPNLDREHLKDADRKYRKLVKEFRKEFLDPYTDLTSLALGDDDFSDEHTAARRKHVEAATGVFNAAKKHFEYARRFLYWFDIRAKFWVEPRPDVHWRGLLAPAAALGRLHEQALALESRLKRAEQLAQHRGEEFEFPGDGMVGSLLSAEGIPASLAVVKVVRESTKPVPLSVST